MDKLPVYVALDVDEEEKALSIVDQVCDFVEGFKVGPRLFFKTGPHLISRLKKKSKVFMDFKFFDIPTTMMAGVRASFDLGADMVTVHAGAGVKVLKSLADLETSLSQKRPFKILAVTALTHFSYSDIQDFVKAESILSYVLDMSQKVISSGLNALVCSGQEVGFLRKKYPKAFLLTPGVRFLEDSTQDQKRTIDPKSAIEKGASALVMGRSIYNTKDPKQNCIKLQKLLF